MWSYIWPILLVVLSNTVYHISSKGTPATANPFMSLVVTYLVGAAIAFILYLALGNRTPVHDFKSLNWTSFVLGVVIVGLEAGWIYTYRAGWKVSMGSLTANISLAVILLFLGVLFYKEHVTLKQVVGTIVCAAGLIIMNI